MYDNNLAGSENFYNKVWEICNAKGVYEHCCASDTIRTLAHCRRYGLSVKETVQAMVDSEFE